MDASVVVGILWGSFLVLSIHGGFAWSACGPGEVRKVMSNKTYSAHVEWDPETRLYVGVVPEIRGAHTQAESLDELQQNLLEVLQLCLEEPGGE
jgi:predicted RNase H-like HicB family nuclease